MNDKIDILIKYYENLIEELNADQHSNPSYLLGRIDMAEEFIGDLKGLKKEIKELREVCDKQAQMLACQAKRNADLFQELQNKNQYDKSESA